MADQSRFGSTLLRWSLRGVLVVSVLVSWPMSGTQARATWPSLTGGSNNAAQSALDVRSLEPSKLIERELAGGQSHSYQITLAADQYLLAIVEQRGIDVVVQLLAFRWHVRPNAVWRFGRVFLECPRCNSRVTRLYVPTSEAWLACRRCWGLSYPSQKQTYKSGGFLGPLLGSWGKAETVLARNRRRVAAQKRYAERRAILAVV